jgi:hypothetical protein
MKFKTLFLITLGLLIISIIINVQLSQHECSEIVSTETKVDTLETEEIIINTSEGNAEMVEIPIDEPYIEDDTGVSFDPEVSLGPTQLVAKYRHYIKSEDVNGTVDIMYLIEARRFRVRDSLTVIHKTVLKTITNNIEVKPPLFQFIASTGVLLTPEREYSLLLASGIRISGKLDLLLAGTSNKQFGVLVGFGF